KIRDLLGEDAVLERLRHVRAGPTGAALAGVVVTDGDGYGVPGGPLERRTVGERVGIFRRANGRIAVLVLVERLATLGEGGEAEREPLADRDVHHRLGEHLRVVAVLEAAARGPFPELRRRAHDVHRAGRRVPAAQRALRAARHLDALDVEEHRAEPPRTRDVDAVDVHGRGGIADLGVVVVADAAHVNF